MIHIFADTKQHNGEDGLHGPHAHTIEIKEETLTLFHTVIHLDGTVEHEMVRRLTPEHLALYLQDIPLWHARGHGAEHITYTQAQHDARAEIHARHKADVLPRPQITLPDGH